MRFRLSILRSCKTIELHVEKLVEPCPYPTNTRLRYFGHRFHFDAFSSVFDLPLSYDMYWCVFVLIHFQERFPNDASARRISVDGRPKPFEMYAFSNENVLVWTSPKPFASLTFLLPSPSSLLNPVAGLFFFLFWIVYDCEVKKKKKWGEKSRTCAVLGLNITYLSYFWSFSRSGAQLRRADLERWSWHIG